jgi:hypothetical protein
LASEHRFNGAMTFQPWKLYTCPINRIPKVSFNGAMTFQPWKWRPSFASVDVENLADFERFIN